MKAKLISKYGIKSLSIPKSIIKKIEAIRKKDSKTFSAVVKDALVEYLNNRKNKIL